MNNEQGNDKYNRIMNLMVAILIEKDGTVHKSTYKIASRAMQGLTGISKKKDVEKNPYQCMVYLALALDAEILTEPLHITLTVKGFNDEDKIFEVLANEIGAKYASAGTSHILSYKYAGFKED